jgi:hypothetical protein
MRVIFADAFAVMKWCGVAGESIDQRNILFSVRSRKKIASSASTRGLINGGYRFGFCSTCFITKCSTRLCRTRLRVGAVAFTPRNLIDANASSPVIGERAAGRKKISRVSCVSGGLAPLRCNIVCARIRRRGSRCYVLFDEIPEGCREQERDQLRWPVLQDQSLHKCRGAKSRRSADEMSPE